MQVLVNPHSYQEYLERRKKPVVSKSTHRQVKTGRVTIPKEFKLRTEKKSNVKYERVVV